MGHCGSLVVSVLVLSSMMRVLILLKSTIYFGNILFETKNMKRVEARVGSYKKR